MLGEFDVHQANVCLMHQGGRLQRLSRTLPHDLRRGELSQLAVNEWQELFRGELVAYFDLLENPRDITHLDHITHPPRELQVARGQRHAVRHRAGNDGPSKRQRSAKSDDAARRA